MRLAQIKKKYKSICKINEHSQSNCDCGDKNLLKNKGQDILLSSKIKIANGVPNKFDAPDDISFLWSCLNRTVTDQRREIARRFAFQKEKLLHQINIPHHRKDYYQVAGQLSRFAQVVRENQR